MPLDSEEMQSTAKPVPSLPSVLMQRGEGWRGRGRVCPQANKDGWSPAFPDADRTGAAPGTGGAAR